MPVAGEPLVRRLLRYGAGRGIRDFVLNLHYLPETITAHVGDGADLGVRVRYSFESPVLGSAGGPRKALPLLPDEPFFIINGDTLTNVDLHALAENHRETGALVTIAVIPNDRPDRYGGLIVDSSGRFHSVVPAGSHVRSYHVVGVQMAHPSAFARLPLNEPAESIGGLYKEPRQRESRARPRVPVRRRFLGRRHAGRLSRRMPVDRQGRGRRAADRTTAQVDRTVCDGHRQRHLGRCARSGPERRSSAASSRTASKFPLEPASAIAPSFRKTESSSWRTSH